MRRIRRAGSPKPRVGFAEEVVTGYSRPVTNDEHWTLFYFEEHAVHCRRCRDPYMVHRSGRRLCDKGHGLAINVARFVYYSKSRNDFFSRSGKDGQEVRVEIPVNYVQTLGLLQAIQRALRRGELWLKAESYDKTHLVPPRPQHADHGKSNSRRSRGSSGSNYEVEVVEPKQPRPCTRRDPILDGSKRGSLYLKDMTELEEQEGLERQLKYNI
jgi:hypothetical protein